MKHTAADRQTVEPCGRCECEVTDGATFRVCLAAAEEAPADGHIELKLGCPELHASSTAEEGMMKGSSGY